MLWVVVLTLAVITLALARQIGLLHQRLPPTGASVENAGPELGELAPEVPGLAMTGEKSIIGGPAAKARMYAFIGPGCGVCDELAPALASIARSEQSAMQVILVSAESEDAPNREFLRKNRLDLPLVRSSRAFAMYGITAPPYALVLDESGVLRAKGTANHLEHLESLLNAVERGFMPRATTFPGEAHIHDHGEGRA